MLTDDINSSHLNRPNRPLLLVSSHRQTKQNDTEDIVRCLSRDRGLMFTTQLVQACKMKITVEDGRYVRLEFEGKLRQASFCSVEAYSSGEDDEGFFDRKGGRGFSYSHLTSEHSMSDKLIKEKQHMSIKNIGESLKRKTRTIGSRVYGFFRLRGFFKRIRRVKNHQRNCIEEEREGLII